MQKTYTNPIARHGDFADPFVLRHDGRYYLYGTNPDVRCWVSDNLIDWTLCGAAIAEDEFPELVPFAPEVVYHNGFFYLYTSPHGRGHYVLRSDKPTGPYKKITGNIGHAIDFSVFVDEDGKWYAYWADDLGILGCEMKSPTEFGKPQLIGAYLHGWTEGPFVVKAGSKYHLTYTGNHYLSKGYRIHTAVSDRPLGMYKDVDNNPVIVRTQGDVVGLGHSSTVLGPNLQSYYIAYHNLNPDRTRDLNIDEVVFEPEGMVVLGPTCSPQAAPDMPDYCCRGEKVISHVLPDSGALEMNMSACAGAGEYGIELGRARLVVSRVPAVLTIMLEDEKLASCALPDDFAHEALHCLRIRWQKEKCTVWLDALRIYEGRLELQGASIAYWGQGVIPGYTAVSGEKVCHVPLQSFLPVDRMLSLYAAEETTCALTWNCAHEGACIKADGQMIQIHPQGFGKRIMMWRQGEHNLTMHGLSGAQMTSQPESREVIEAEVKRFGPYGKQVLTEAVMDADISVTIRAEQRDADWEAGILLRANHLADGGEGDDPVLGRNFMVGYRMAISAQGLTLYKHRYDCVPLAHADWTGERLSISLRGNVIAVDAEGQCVITYKDDRPIVQGCIGFDARNCLIDGEIVCIPVHQGGTHE